MDFGNRITGTKGISVFVDFICREYLSTCLRRWYSGRRSKGSRSTRTSRNYKGCTSTYGCYNLRTPPCCETQESSSSTSLPLWPQPSTNHPLPSSSHLQDQLPSQLLDS